MYIGTFFTGFIWAIFGAFLMYFYMKNKTSKNPDSYLDEVENLKKYLEALVDAKFHQQTITPVFLQAVPPTVEHVETLKVEAENVELMNRRAEDTSTTAGAKTFGFGHELNLDDKEPK